MLLGFRLRSAFSAASTLLAVSCGGAVGTTSATGSPGPAGSPDPAASASPSDPGMGPAQGATTGQGSAVPTNARCSTAARTLATGAGYMDALALDPAAVVITATGPSGTMTLSKVDPISGTATVVASSTWLSLVGVDGGTVVWTDGKDRHLYAAPIKGGPTADLGVRLADYDGSYTAPLLGVAGGFVVWADGKTGMSSFYSLPVSGGAVVHHTLAAGGPSPSSWVAFDGSLLWATSSALWIGAVPDGAGAAQFASVLDKGWEAIIGYHAGTAYVSGTSGIDAIDVATRRVRNLLPSSVVYPSSTPALFAKACSPGKWGFDDFVVGLDETVYATGFTDCMNGTGAGPRAYFLLRMRPGASEPSAIAMFFSGANAVPHAVDDACLYWIENDGTTATLKTIAR